MAKTVETTETTESKWDKFAGGILKEEPLVDLFIPKDKINPVKHVWVSLNGNEIYLGKGVRMKVPQSIYELYMNSYNDTLEAEAKINTDNEVQVGG